MFYNSFFFWHFAALNLRAAVADRRELSHMIGISKGVKLDNVGTKIRRLLQTIFGQLFFFAFRP